MYWMDRWMNQAYSRLSTTHDHITDCKLDSVVYAGVSVVIFITCIGSYAFDIYMCKYIQYTIGYKILLEKLNYV